MAADKHWMPPKSEFRRHISHRAVQSFRERADRAITLGEPDHRLALEIDRRVQVACEARPPQDITMAVMPDEATQLVEIPMRTGHTAFAVLQQVRPNGYPPVPCVGGPNGAGQGVVALVDTDRAAENFATGRWKVSFRPLQVPLSKLQLGKPQEEERPVATGNVQEPEPETKPEFKETTMDASPPNRKSYTNMLAQAAQFGPQAMKTAHVVVLSGGKKDRRGRRAKRRYSDEYKREMARRVVRGEVTFRDAVDTEDLTEATLRNWIVAFKKKGRSGAKAVKAPSPRSASPARQDRIEFAKEQLKLRPYTNVMGKNGLNQMIIDRFGRGLSDRLLSSMRAEAIKAEGGQTDARRGGITDDVRTLMSDGVARTASEAAKALNYSPSLMSKLLSNIARRDKVIHRISPGTYQWVGAAKNPRVAASRTKAKATSDVGSLVGELTAALQSEAEAKAEVERCAAELGAAEAIYSEAKSRASELISQLHQARAQT